ncbi:MAG: helix-turn-helix transcriptional regulator, partial [Thermoguttaceae bacterium]
MHTSYIQPAIRELRDQQVRFAPREKKLEQVDRAERLLLELETQRIYTYEYLCYRVTTYRPEAHPEVRMRGDEASHDLRLFVEDLSDSADLPIEDVPEPVLTVEELSRRFRVSTKTISRWRQQGLVSRRFVFAGRKRVGFLESSVHRFVQHNAERVRRGAQFSQLTADEREKIVDYARRLAQKGGCPADVTRRLARKMGRSVETIRYTLKQFDRDNPDVAIFPENTGPLRDDTKQKNYRRYSRG